MLLEREHLTWYRFDGTMDIRRRSEAIAGFKAASEGPKVLIISLKAGGVGLNVRRTALCQTLTHGPIQLTNANHVFMVTITLCSLQCTR